MRCIAYLRSDGLVFQGFCCLLECALLKYSVIVFVNPTTFGYEDCSLVFSG